MECPGPLTTVELFDTSSGKLLPDLMVIKDYRCVRPLVYYIFIELYGRDDSEELYRYNLDIYSRPAHMEFVIKNQRIWKKKARHYVHKLRQKCMRWKKEAPGLEKDEERCCGLSEDHIKTILFWAFTCCCCMRQRSGRGDIQYRSYRTVSTSDNEEDENNDSDNIEDSSTSSSLGGSSMSSVHSSGSMHSSSMRSISGRSSSSTSSPRRRQLKEMDDFGDAERSYVEDISNRGFLAYFR